MTHLSIVVKLRQNMSNGIPYESIFYQIKYPDGTEINYKHIKPVNSFFDLGYVHPDTVENIPKKEEKIDEKTLTLENYFEKETKEDPLLEDQFERISIDLEEMTDEDITNEETEKPNRKRNLFSISDYTSNKRTKI